MALRGQRLVQGRFCRKHRLKEIVCARTNYFEIRSGRRLLIDETLCVCSGRCNFGEVPRYRVAEESGILRGGGGDSGDEGSWAVAERIVDEVLQLAAASAAAKR